MAIGRLIPLPLAGGASGAISGTATITFSPAGALTGDGALAGTTTITFSPAANLIGDAPIAGTTALTFTPAGALAGEGALVGTTTITFATAGDLTGTAANVSTPQSAGSGGWDANEFAKLRRSLARKKRKLREEAREIIAEAVPVLEAAEQAIDASGMPEAPDMLAPLVEAMRAQIGEIERAVTQHALADVAREIAALSERIEDELDDEEALLLLAA